MPLIGRREEIQALLGARDAAARGEPQVAFIGGETGIGKTRLLHEFLETAEAKGSPILLDGAPVLTARPGQGSGAALSQCRCAGGGLGALRSGRTQGRVHSTGDTAWVQAASSPPQWSAGLDGGRRRRHWLRARWDLHCRRFSCCEWRERRPDRGSGGRP